MELEHFLHFVLPTRPIDPVFPRWMTYIVRAFPKQVAQVIVAYDFRQWLG